MMTIKSHIMHEAHALVLTRNTTDYTYLCNGCKTFGNGKNFRCQPCNFDMHEFCIDCPTELASFLHPQHCLNLLVKNSELATSLTTCDVCGDGVNGLFYCCDQSCNFNVHPLCTQFPRFLCHAVHGLHQLEFQKPYVDAVCSICRDVCDSWRYRCGECDGFDVHVDCMTKPGVTTSTFTRPCAGDSGDSTHKNSTSRHLPPYAGTYAYGGVCSPNPNPNPNSHNKYNPAHAYYLNPHNMYNSYSYTPNMYTHHINNPYNFYGSTWPGSNPHNVYNGQIPYDSNLQNVHSHHGPGHNVQSNSSHGHGFGKIGSKIFSILGELTLEVFSSAIYDATDLENVF